MIREVNLVSYLPQFLTKYKETNAALKAENPEFNIIWDAADKILYNEFISTADEYGIARLESMLKLNPSDEDTLESRRARLQSKWLSTLPYTLKMLIKNLTVLCAGDDFKITKNFDSYAIRVTTHLRLYSQIQELQDLLERMIPVNMVILSFNSIIYDVDGAAKIYTGLRLSSLKKKIKVEVKNYGMA